MKNVKHPTSANTTSAMAQFVASDDIAKKAVSTPAGAWPFPTTAGQLQGAATGEKAKVTPPAKRVSTASNAASKVAAKQFVSPIKYIVRGTGATKLFAHTAAWLELTGLIHGHSAPLDLVKELGGSAYSYHFRKGNFTAPMGGMVELTAKGINHFGSREEGAGRRFDPQDKEHYMLMMMEGVNDDRLIKDASAIRPYKAA